MPAWEGGKIGILDFGAALKPHASWGEAGHGRAAREFEKFFVKGLKLPAADVSDLIWAELHPKDRSRFEHLLLAKVATDPARLQEALRARGFAPATGGEGRWTRESGPTPESVAHRDGWLVRTTSEPEVLTKVLDAWSGTSPSARSLAHARTLAAGLPSAKPAILRFGIEEQPLPDSPLRVIAMALAPDPAAGEEVVIVAFDAESGPETMTASETWKKHVAKLVPPPGVDRKGACLRVATIPESDPAFVDARRREVMARLGGLRNALEAYRMQEGRYPAKLKALTEGEFPVYTDDLWDAWGHDWIYRFEGGSFEVRSPGPDGREGTADDVEDPLNK
ncbi:MAG: type II secretion system protein GspG [Planctomycetes bacterium]|nr:type II secretion system protein GspG [Planctomycetota bacterium]